MKAHEETWELLAGRVKVPFGDGDCLVIDLGSKLRNKLAAQAPAMARRLLKWQAECGCNSDKRACPDCEADRAVLRDAGVYEETPATAPYETCIDCNRALPDARSRPCPYAEEILDETVIVTICDDCAHERWLDT